MSAYDQMKLAEKINRLYKHPTYVKADEVDLKINLAPVSWYAPIECYREIMVSYIPMLPLIERPQVSTQDADYIVYMNPYARCEDVSDIVLDDLYKIANARKEGAEIIVVGKSANAEALLNGSIKNITFWGDHFTEKLGKKFDIDMREQYFVYDDYAKHLAMWPVDGCLQQCKFCRRSYMHIKFESLSLETIKRHLDQIREQHPEWLETISLRAENLTEYGIDIYGKQMLHELIDLIDSYEEVKSIKIPIGVSIGEITPEILDSLCRTKKLTSIAMNLEAGSDRLLEVIGKKHTRADAIHIFNKIRESHPNIHIESTIMIGLPTEEIEDMFALADLIGQTKPDYIVCNYYVWAPKQPLAKLPQLSESLREYHHKILLKELQYHLQRNLSMECWRIFKNKKSRQTVRLLEKQKRNNKREVFPSHYIMGYKWTIK